MIQKKVRLNNKQGLHGRPAAVLVQEAEKFSAEMKLIKENKEANLKSILGLLWLKVKDKEELTLQIKGQDENTAAEKIVDLIENKLPVVSYQQNNPELNKVIAGDKKNSNPIAPTDVVKMLGDGVRKNLNEIINSKENQ